jgi:hypothetical protein
VVAGSRPVRRGGCGEGVGDVELVGWLVLGGDQSEDGADRRRFHHRRERFFKV